MIELHISHTGKGYGRGEEYCRWHDETVRQPDLAAAKAWLKDTYGKSKRQPMFRDVRDGKGGWKVVKTGYVVKFNGWEWSRRDSGEPYQYHYRAQDWIEFREVKTLELP